VRAGLRLHAISFCATFDPYNAVVRTPSRARSCMSLHPPPIMGIASHIRGATERFLRAGSRLSDSAQILSMFGRKIFQPKIDPTCNFLLGETSYSCNSLISPKRSSRSCKVECGCRLIRSQSSNRTLLRNLRNGRSENCTAAPGRATRSNGR